VVVTLLVPGENLMHFTQAAIEALTLPQGKTDHIEWDPSLPGFGVRVRATSKNWRIQYRIARRQRSESIGDIRRVKLDAARKIARQRFASIELGVDPVAEKAAAATRLTFAAVVAMYLDFKRPLLRPSSYAAATRYFAVQWGPFATRPLDAITRADVAARLQWIGREHGRVSAARARANLSALLGWCMREGLTEHNVAIGTNNPAQGLPSRERVLDSAEIQRIWNACGDDDFGAIVRLLLLTGQRRNEIADLCWSEVDLDSALITLPAVRVKNKRPHSTPLSPPALAMLQSRPREAERDLVFGSGDRGFTSWSNSKRAFDSVVGTAVPSWTLHDLRRTVATGMADIDVDPHVIEAVLNHTSGSKRGVAGVYNRSSYERQTRIALDRWADHVLAVVEGRESVVVPLRQA
jgi:integrase